MIRTLFIFRTAKLFFVGVFLLLCISTASAQYKPVDKGSSVNFGVRNLGIRINGSFSGLRGKIDFPKNRAEAHVDISIDANTISTKNEMRDKHLRGEEFFDVAKYPTMHFTSTSVTMGKDDALIMTGDLTIKGVTKSVSFPFTAATTKTGYTFKTTFTINREDFNVGHSRVISDEVQITVELVAEKTE